MSIKVNNLSYIYDEGMPFETIALDNIDFEISEGEFIGLIGHTGSGKSTLIQILDGLLKPSKGKVLINNKNIFEKNENSKKMRKKIGLVFQYPEHQLFEETIYKDISFGPKNLGLDKDEINKRVCESMDLVGLEFEKYKDISPFELSGGQKRRAAIAGVLAMDPDVLILDEPTAGLDPKGRDEILNQIKKMNEKKNKTVILVSHSMEEIANLVNRLIVLSKGKKVLDGSVRDVFKKADLLKKIGLGVPQITKLINKLNEKGFQFEDTILTVDEAKRLILSKIGGSYD